VIGVHHSDPLSVIVKSMLRFSTNLSAEVLGLMASGERGSLSASAATMNTWAQTRLGLANATFKDHSGLSDRTRISPVSFARAMARAEQTFPEFAPLLKPIKSRQFNGTLDKTGRAQIAAKTGTLNFVSALGGYQISEGRKIAFAIFVQDFGKRAKVDLAKNDRPRGASNWAKRARRLHHGLLYRWARMEF
jgi:D-alanyl-D-alanine carboxypeptidase/D-alanyl-D-alanine-endopeptidase (penicillin-binding protein 4)